LGELFLLNVKKIRSRCHCMHTSHHFHWFSLAQTCNLPVIQSLKALWKSWKSSDKGPTVQQKTLLCW